MAELPKRKKVMTVRQLIRALQALPEEKQGLPVWCGMGDEYEVYGVECTDRMADGRVYLTVDEWEHEDG